MTTFLQSLLLKTTSDDDAVLQQFIQYLLPHLEREYGTVPALGGSYEYHFERLKKRYQARRLPNALEKADEVARSYSSRPEQGLLVHVLNALLISWNVSAFLPKGSLLDDTEKRLLCLGLTLHDYNKYIHAYGEEDKDVRPADVKAIMGICQEMGDKLHFDEFWPEWKNYLLEIAFLAQNTQGKVGTNLIQTNWIQAGQFTLDERRLANPLRHLMAFGDIAVHLQNPSEIETDTGGQRLQEKLRFLGVHKKLAYHRLRDSRGLLTNIIHNTVIQAVEELDWQPLLFFAHGVVYLVPKDFTPPKPEEIGSSIWQQISGVLQRKMSEGEIGFRRDGKGIKVAPLSLELMSPADLIRQLPQVVESKVANEKSPATPKRLEKLELDEDERQRLNLVADLRSDRLAELLSLVQREFFPDVKDYPAQVLAFLELQNTLTSEETQVQSGGVNYGWYRAAAHYVHRHATLDYREVLDHLQAIANKIADWGEEAQLFPAQKSPTQEDFSSYLEQYLEVTGWRERPSQFSTELQTYCSAKTRNLPLCSLSSGEFIAEEQLDSVVHFKPQQYSNKNSLGGGRIKRGISRVWSLEMLLRQAQWQVTNKLEEQFPIFLYIYPAYVHSPQMTKTIRQIVISYSRPNLWDVRKVWVDSGMNLDCLQSIPLDEEVSTDSRPAPRRFSVRDLPFVAVIPVKGRNKTDTEAWIDPTYLALTLPRLLGVKVVATPSSTPLYVSDEEFHETVRLDGAAGFINVLGIPVNLSMLDIHRATQRLLVTYCIHLDSRSDPPSPRWHDLVRTARDLSTDILNVFSIAQEGLRREKADASERSILRFCKYADIMSDTGDEMMVVKLRATKDIAEKMYAFYRAGLRDSGHTLLLPLSKTLDLILSVPDNWDDEELINQATGQLQAVLERQEAYKRPMLMNKAIPLDQRTMDELTAIHSFVKACVVSIFHGLCNGDRAILQEHNNRIKDGVEFAYKLLIYQQKAASEDTSKNVNN